MFNVQNEMGVSINLPSRISPQIGSDKASVHHLQSLHFSPLQVVDPELLPADLPWLSTGVCQHIPRSQRQGKGNPVAPVTGVKVLEVEPFINLEDVGFVLVS